MKELTVPEEALKYILLQRLEVQNIGGAIHYTKLGRILYALYERSSFLRLLYRFYSQRLEPMLRGKHIAKRYSELMLNEFNTIKPYIGAATEKVLGIGPGVAGLEAYLSDYINRAGGKRPSLYLVDKNEITDVYYGYHEEAAAYSSLNVAKTLLKQNGHPEKKVQTIDAKDLESTELKNIDLVVSLIAWGFHFPVTTYLHKVRDIMKDGAQLIIDVRKETDGRATLEEAFGEVKLIMDDEKFERVLAVK